MRVPTSLNVMAIDLVHPERFDAPPALADDQRELLQGYLELGCAPTLTCAPYQRLPRPSFGEHVAWAESNATVFVNSCLGARSDRYGDFTDLCAALTGRVPEAGLHRSENRRARLVLRVAAPEACDLDRDLWFACLGYALGEIARDRVAVIVGAPADTTEAELKALGAAAASSGSPAAGDGEATSVLQALQLGELGADRVEDRPCLIALRLGQFPAHPEEKRRFHRIQADEFEGTS